MNANGCFIRPIIPNTHQIWFWNGWNRLAWTFWNGPNLHPFVNIHSKLKIQSNNQNYILQHLEKIYQLSIACFCRNASTFHTCEPNTSTFIFWLTLKQLYFFPEMVFQHPVVMTVGIRITSWMFPVSLLSTDCKLCFPPRMSLFFRCLLIIFVLVFSLLLI